MNRNPPRGRPFQKGKTGNPKGSSLKSRTRGATTRLLQGLSASKGETLTPEALATVLSTVLLGKHADLAGLESDDRVASAQAYAARLWQMGYESGDLAIFKAFVEMLVGKPKERTTMELMGKDGNAIEVKTKEELLSTAMALRAQVDSLGDE